MGIIERRLRQKEEVKMDILKAAWELAKKDGWQAVSIRKIADAIEYSVPVIYDHFENKEAILLEFAKLGFEKLNKQMETAKNQHEDPADQIKAMADAYWEFAINNTEKYQLMYGIGMASCDVSMALPEQQKLMDTVTAAIETMAVKSKRTDINSCLKYHTFWSVMHGLISIKIVGNSAVDAQLNKMVLDDAIAGFIKNMT